MATQPPVPGTSTFWLVPGQPYWILIPPIIANPAHAMNDRKYSAIFLKVLLSSTVARNFTSHSPCVPMCVWLHVCHPFLPLLSLMLYFLASFTSLFWHPGISLWLMQWTWMRDRLPGHRCHPPYFTTSSLISSCIGMTLHLQRWHVCQVKPPILIFTGREQCHEGSGPSCIV